MELWLIGKPFGTGWMVEGAYETESEAATHAEVGEFIALVEVGDRFPKEATDAKKLYYPKMETWEQSALYKMRHNQEFICQE